MAQETPPPIRQGLEPILGLPSEAEYAALGAIIKVYLESHGSKVVHFQVIRGEPGDEITVRVAKVSPLVIAQAVPTIPS